jgi:hypothetical protein
MVSACASGQPDKRHESKLKRITFHLKLNCGKCVSKHGNKCSEVPYCSNLEVSIGRCNTIWYESAFKDGVYGRREMVWAFCDADERPVEQLEGGTVAALGARSARVIRRFAVCCRVTVGLFRQSVSGRSRRSTNRATPPDSTAASMPVAGHRQFAHHQSMNVETEGGRVARPWLLHPRACRLQVLTLRPEAQVFKPDGAEILRTTQ